MYVRTVDRQANRSQAVLAVRKKALSKAQGQWQMRLLEKKEKILQRARVQGWPRAGCKGKGSEWLRSSVGRLLTDKLECTCNNVGQRMSLEVAPAASYTMDQTTRRAGEWPSTRELTE